MPIPDYETLMLPLLKSMYDQKEHDLSELTEKLSQQFGLTDEERAQVLPSGKTPTMRSRVGWAKTYLKAAGLLDNPVRGTYLITQVGLTTLEKKPEKIDVNFLKRFPDFLEFLSRSTKDSGPKPLKEKGKNSVVAPNPQTPEELFRSSYETLRSTLASELLGEIAKAPSGFFEYLVVDLLVAMGYGGSQEDAATVVGKPGDEGIDGLIKQDRLGLDNVYVQAKRWKGQVSRPDVQAFVGSLEGFKATKGVFITTSDFSEPAQQYVKNIGKKIVLIDGNSLAQLLIDYNVGVTQVESFTLKRIDLDRFEID